MKNDSTECTDIDRQFQGVLEFQTEIVPASHKTLMNSIVAVKAEMLMVDVNDLRVLDGFNPRIQDERYHAHVRTIADSIKENGYYPDKPLAGYGGLDGRKPVIYVTDGFCRTAALKLAISEGAPISEVPLVLKDKSTTMEDLTVAFVVSNKGKNLTPMELAIVCKRLVGFGWTVQRIAEKVQITVEYVSQLLTLAGAPRHIREMVQSGEVTAALAIETMRKHGADAGEALNAGLAAAKATGKTRLTKKFMPAQVQRKFFIKNAPQMFSVMERIRALASYGAMPPDIRSAIDDLVKGAAIAAEPKSEPGVKGNTSGSEANP
ncbi:MAG: ParB/RepB/Spo0J family partition protein [Burkholderiaceae bacterium]|nr:MAG: ParB/RepB/Spo0J family partition protein [Burkholderiaceae bacterium]TBR76668.1 MAG: ParB/RepB/Spo0J family partition protein [Burkholderiaceae bacterium]